MAAPTKSELAAQARSLQKSLAREKAKGARAQRKLADALAQQAATADILRVISNSPAEAQPVFDAIASSATRLCDAEFCVVFRFDGAMITVAADDGRSPGTLDVIRAAYPSPPGRRSIAARAIAERRVISIADAQKLKGYPQQAKRARAIGYRSILAVPMMRGDAAIGSINVARFEAIAFSDAEVELLKAFADQAVIAIENARLFNETREALERQTATAEILKVIAASPTDVQPVFEAIARSALRLIGGLSSSVTRVVDGMQHLAAFTTTNEAGDQSIRNLFPRRVGDLNSGRAILARAPVFETDIETDPEVSPDVREHARARGHRSILSVPMLRDSVAIGAISVTRREPGPFSDHQVNLLETFADQAVIAIENVRLFTETREALERQTATAEILRVIAGSPSDVQPVFDTIAKSALALCGGMYANVFHFDGELLHFMATANLAPRGVELMKAKYPMRPDATQASGRVILTGADVRIEDLSLDPDYDPRLVLSGWPRRMLAVPMLREGTPVGVIVVAWGEPGPVSRHHEELLRTFADQAVIAIGNVRLFNETKEALERQTATAEILKVIARSPADVQPVFDAIVRSCQKLFGGRAVTLVLPKGEQLHSVAFADDGTALDDKSGFLQPWPADRESVAGTCILESRMVAVGDTEQCADQYPRMKSLALALGYRAVVCVPLLRDGTAIGAIGILRAEPGEFAEKEIALANTFADQAVIAIENVRLFNETKEALERQTATSEILKVIASSPSDVTPVFDAIAARAHRLLDGLFSVVARREGDMLHLAAHTAASATGDRLLQGLFPTPITGDGAMGKAVLSGEPVCVDDIETDPAYSEGFRKGARKLGMRSMVNVPMLREGESIGVISVSLARAGAIAEHQTNLLRAFADQAVIAIENVRLFNETKESLERQTATAEILKVISESPADVQPVFDAIAGSARRLIGGVSATVFRVEDGIQHLVAFTAVNPAADELLKALYPAPLGESNSGRAILTRAPAVRIDTESDPGIRASARENARARGYRSLLAVPMLRDGLAIGAISVARAQPGDFSPHQIGLLQTFADQAVIAIGNVRLFNETREALERQTATAEILKVIASSPGDVQPVFDVIVSSAVRLFGGHAAAVTRVVGDSLHLAAFTATSQAGNEVLKNSFPRPLSSPSMHTTTARTGKPLCVSDVQRDPNVLPETRAVALARDIGSQLIVPMLREMLSIGTISVTRREVRPFTDRQINLLQTFADQAVIAIENVRLFNETKEALERQTATAEILDVISRSTTDVQPVFDAVAAKAVKLCDGSFSVVFRFDGDLIHVAATCNMSPEAAAAVRGAFPAPPSGRGAASRAIQNRSIVHIPDVTADPEYRPGGVAHLARMRSIVAVPMLRAGSPLGAIAVQRAEPRPFSEQQIALLRAFADQAVIAIENVRLFKELEARTEALTKSVGQLTALGEVGQAISSSLDLETVLKTIVSRAVQLTGLDAGGIYEYDERTEEFSLRAADNMDAEIVEILRSNPIRKGEGAVGGTAVTRAPIQVPETQAESYQSRLRELLVRTGRRALLAVPLLREDHIIGALAVQRNTPGPFAPEVVELLQTFATQSAMAIQNARLFREIEEKGKQLEVASRHKSDFLASMSHELRTPLNAILGFNEMILGEVYGDVPPDMKEPLADIQASGKHLLRLINNVLDLAKIEAGRMELAPQEYAVQDLVESVRSTLRPLAAEKGLDFLASVPNDIPLAYGDAGRITQCLMNLAGNSLKFTKAGRVEIKVEMRSEVLLYQVLDTGIGIPPEKIGSLFTEFRQSDATIAGEYGGTGLGLSISKKFVEMHGGRIWVESEPGRGSAFLFEIPLRLGTGGAA